MRQLIAVAALVAGGALAADTGDRSRLAGTWEAARDGETRTSWTVTENGESLHISRAENDRKVSEVECNTLGRQCELKDGGKTVKVSMWFNGPKLVVTETRGTEILKRRFTVTGDGNAMQMEVIPIVPQGKPEVIRLTRTPASH